MLRRNAVIIAIGSQIDKAGYIIYNKVNGQKISHLLSNVVGHYEECALTALNECLEMYVKLYEAGAWRGHVAVIADPAGMSSVNIKLCSIRGRLNDGMNPDEVAEDLRKDWMEDSHVEAIRRTAELMQVFLSDKKLSIRTYAGIDVLYDEVFVNDENAVHAGAEVEFTDGISADGNINADEYNQDINGVFKLHHFDGRWFIDREEPQYEVALANCKLIVNKLKKMFPAEYLLTDEDFVEESVAVAG